jgi:hypothetical protein
MAKRILLEEFHVTVHAPIALQESKYLMARRTLNSRGFRVQLRRAVDDVFRRHPSLKAVRISISA